MSNQDHYREMIDAYLSGKLSPEDSDRLMESLGQDPALKEEFLLQKDLVHSLQNTRRAELKNRLNQIEVGSGYTAAPSALSIKFIAGAALLALLGTGTYFVLNQPEDEAVKAPEKTEVAEVSKVVKEPAAPAPEVKEADKVLHTPSLTIGVEEASEAASSEAESAERQAAAGKPKTEKKPEQPAHQPAFTAKNKEVKPAADATATPATAEVVKPEVITFFDEQDPAGSVPLAETPEDKLKNARKFDTRNIEVATKSDLRYPFHYMFYENQLSIYGDFSKVPYEVLEVNTGSQASYFLYHNGAYYELNPDQRKITRLKELTNDRLIRELELTRSEKLKQ